MAPWPNDDTALRLVYDRAANPDVQFRVEMDCKERIRTSLTAWYSVCASATSIARPPEPVLCGPFPRCETLQR